MPAALPRGRCNRRPRFESRNVLLHLGTRGLWAGPVFAGLFLFIPSSASAAGAEADAETSRELEIRYRIDPESRIHFLQSVAENESQSFREGTTGLAFDRKLNKRWSWRIGARYIGSFEDDDETGERRALVDLSYKAPIGEKWAIYNRVRTDLRWVDAKAFSSRIRDRLLLERSTSLWGHPLAAYVSHEIFYDSRYDAIVRGRSSTGLAFEVTPRATIDLYYSVTRDTKPENSRLSSLGISLVFQLGSVDAN